MTFDARMIAAALAAATVLAACGGPANDDTAPSATTYSAAEVAQLPGVLTDVAISDGDIYLSANDGLYVLDDGAGEPRHILDSTGGYGLSVSAGRAFWGIGQTVTEVDLATGVSTEHELANIAQVWTVASDDDGNVYVGGDGRAAPRLLRFSSDWHAPQQVTYDSESTPYGLVVADGVMYSVDPLQGQVTRIREDGSTELLNYDGMAGASAIAVSEAGDLFVVSGDDPGRWCTCPLPVTLRMYPAGSETPIELARYESQGWGLGVGDDGSVYYTWDDEQSHLVKLSPA